MTERLIGIKRTEVFHRPNPYDLVSLSSTFDGREVAPPPRTYSPATDPERQLREVTLALRNTFGNNLMLVGLTGSRIDRPQQSNRDLDVLAIVDDDASGDQVIFQGDLKILSYSGLREFIECGYQLITTQFRKVRPIFQREDAQEKLDEAREWKVVPERAIPFLIAKSKFNAQTSDIEKLMSDKNRAIFLHQYDMEQEAYSQLRGEPQDVLFGMLQLNVEDDDPRMVYAQLARFYANVGLNRMFHSISEMVQSLHIKEEEDVADVEQLISWARVRLGNTVGDLFQYIYEKRISCYKAGELLLDKEYLAMREEIRTVNPVIERIVLGGKSYENWDDERPIQRHN